MTRAKRLFGVLALAFMIAGCDGDNPRTPTPIPPTSTPEPTPHSPILDLPAPSNGGLILPEGIDGGLQIVRGSSLYLSWFDGTEPVLIAEGVAPVMIAPSPDGRAVVYAVGVTEERPSAPYEHFEYRLAVTDLSTLHTTQLLGVGDERRLYAILLGWSPDGQTVLVWNSGTIVASSVDGLNVEILAGTRTVAWLRDSTALLFAPEQLIDRASPLAVFRVEPDFGHRTKVDVPLDDAVWPDFLHLAGALAERGLAYDGTAFHDFYRAAQTPDGDWVYIEWSETVKNMQTLLCDTWEIRRAGTPPETLYTAENTTFLSDLTALPDGSLLFLKWTRNRCHYFGKVTVELVRLVPGQEPDVITSRIDPGAHADPNRIGTLGYWRARKYTVTPDGRYVFWIGRGDVEGVSLVGVTDLRENLTAHLLADVVLPDGEGQFADVFWIPRPVEEEEE
jgi:hypothetical protein